MSGPVRWNAAKCAKMAKRVERDGYGTRYAFPGFIGPHYPGQWSEGLPAVAAGFRVVRAPGFHGWRIVGASAP